MAETIKFDASDPVADTRNIVYPGVDYGDHPSDKLSLGHAIEALGDNKDLYANYHMDDGFNRSMPDNTEILTDGNDFYLVERID